MPVATTVTIARCGGTAYAADAAQARGAGSPLSRGVPARLVPGVVHHHRHSRPADQSHGRPDPGPRTTPGAPSICGLYPCQDGGRLGDLADRPAHCAGQSSVTELRSAVRKEPGPDCAGEELLHHVARLRAGAKARGPGTIGAGPGKAEGPP